MPRPPADSTRSFKYVQGEFEKADRNIKPDPGRVTARRLNRSEYTNTIRDLLGVEFRAEKRLPDRRLRQRLRQHRRRADDLAGADGEVPRRRPSGSPPGRSAPTRCPRSRSRSEYHVKDKTDPPRRSAAPSKPTHRIEFDGEYIVRIGLPGERARGRQAGDARLLDGRQAAATPAGRNQAVRAGLLRSVLGRRDAAVPARRRSRLPRRLHRRRFREDADRRRTPTTSKKNKFLDSITFVGPFPSKVEKASRKKILICDPNIGPRLRRQDRRRRWRGAPTAVR